MIRSPTPQSTTSIRALPIGKLLDFRARLAASENPMRILTAVADVVTRANLVKEKRVLEFTPLYDAVTTMDTVTLLRRGIRGVYRESITKDSAYQGALRGLIEVEGYLPSAKPTIDWKDNAAREALIDAIANDATTVLAFFENKPTTELELVSVSSGLKLVVFIQTSSAARAISNLGRLCLS